MNITHNSTGELTMQLVLNIVESDYADEVKKSLEQYRKQANIPGFRPGKVPFGMVKKMYGESVIADVVSHAIGDALDKYMAEQKLSILGQPLPDKVNQKPVDFKNEKDFTFYYIVGLKPEINLELNESLGLTFHNIMADDEDVEKYLGDIRKQMGTQTQAEKVSEGDVISGSMKEVDADGNVVEGGIAIENTSLHVDYIKLKTIKAKFIGKKTGNEIVFNPAKAFKNDAEVGSLLGIGSKKAKDVEADFMFTIDEINHHELAEINEELYAKVYENSHISSEEELRARIKTDIELTYKSESERKFFNDAIEAIIKQTDLNLPDAFLKEWIMESNLREEEDKRIAPEELDAQYDAYRDSLRWQLLEEHIVVSNNLMVTEQEIRDRVKELLGLQSFGGDTEANSEIINQVTESIMQNKEEIKRVSDQIIEQKLTKYFMENIKPTELNLRYDDFVEMIKAAK
jgi:trigger factor